MGGDGAAACGLASSRAESEAERDSERVCGDREEGVPCVGFGVTARDDARVAERLEFVCVRVRPFDVLLPPVHGTLVLEESVLLLCLFDSILSRDSDLVKHSTRTALIQHRQFFRSANTVF